MSAAFQPDGFQPDAYQIGRAAGGAPPAADPFFMMLHRIEHGMVAITAAGMDGVLET